MTETYQPHLPIGTILGEHKIEKILGEGSFGITYMVSDQNLGRQFALKEYLPSRYRNSPCLSCPQVSDRREASDQ